jgi:hypothetical protein
MEQEKLALGKFRKREQDKPTIRRRIDYAILLCTEAPSESIEGSTRRKANRGVGAQRLRQSAPVRAASFRICCGDSGRGPSAMLQLPHDR